MSTGNFITKVRNKRTLWNEYDCSHCKKAGILNAVVHVPHGHTTNRSDWGSGIAMTRRECVWYGRWDGPWVSADLVGGGW